MYNDLDFSIVERANIPTSHFAKVCGVSRLTATLWLKGNSTPRGLYGERAKARLNAIQQALDKGDLPLPSMPRAQRLAALADAINANS